MTRNFWTQRQLATLRRLYPNLKADTVAQELGRTTRSVYQKAKQLGLRKSDAFKQSFLSGRIRAAHTDPRMVATRFRPGQASWNKGVKGSTGLHDNCRPTQFKPGLHDNCRPTQFKPGQKPRNKSPELAKLIQLKGAITRQVNRIAREAQETQSRPRPTSTNCATT